MSTNIHLQNALSYIKEVTSISNETLIIVEEELKKYFSEHNLEIKEYERIICWWSGIDIEYIIDDVLEVDIEYTKEDINNILDLVEHTWDAEYGVNWDFIKDKVKEYFDIREK